MDWREAGRGPETSVANARWEELLYERGTQSAPLRDIASERVSVSMAILTLWKIDGFLFSWLAWLREWRVAEFAGLVSGVDHARAMTFNGKMHDTLVPWRALGLICRRPPIVDDR